VETAGAGNDYVMAAVARTAVAGEKGKGGVRFYRVDAGGKGEAGETTTFLQ